MSDIKLNNIELGDTGSESRDKINNNNVSLKNAIDNLDTATVKNTDISQMLGTATNKVPSEKAISDTLANYPRKSEVLLGTIQKGSKANEAEIKAIASPSAGDTYRALDTNHYWSFDGTQWNDIGKILPDDLAPRVDSGGNTVVYAPGGKILSEVAGQDSKKAPNLTLFTKIYDAVNSELIGDVQTIPSSLVTNNAYIRASTVLQETGFDKYEILIYPCKAGDNISIKTAIQGMDLLAWSVFSTNVVSPANMILQGTIVNNNSELTNIDSTFTVPENGAYIYATHLKAQSITVSNIDSVGNVYKTFVNKSDIIYNKTIDTVQAELIGNNVELSYDQTISSNYIQASTVRLDSPYPAYEVLRYPCTVGDTITITTTGKGKDVMSWGIFSANTVSSANLLIAGSTIDDNLNFVNISESLTVPIGGAYIFVTHYVGQNIKLVSGTVQPAVYEEIKKINIRIDALVSGIDINANPAWVAMNKTDLALAQKYSQHYIDIKSHLNNSYDFGNILLTENFIVPAIGGTVVIAVSNTSLLAVGKKICIGTKDFYDIYNITAISGLNVTVSLQTNRTNYVGKTLNYQTTFISQVSGQNITNKLQVFTYDDLMGYHSNVIPASCTSDYIHPTNTGYNYMSQSLAERITMIQGVPVRLIAFGDSFIHSSSPLLTYIQTIFGAGTTIINQGIQGDRVEHIKERFLTYMSTYTPQSGDVFLFLMGTNNLYDFYRNKTDIQKMFFNYSYMDIFLDSLATISSKLPLGNWFVSTGHPYSLYYKENTSIG